MGFSGTSGSVSSLLIVLFLLGAMIIPLAGPVGDVKASPLVQVSVDMEVSTATATVDHDDGDELPFKGAVTVEQVGGVSQVTTISGSTSSGWNVIVSPTQYSSNGPGTILINVHVSVPAGVADGHTDTLTVRASSQIAFLTPTVATDTIEITVDNNSPKPEWVVRILEPANNEVYTTDDLTISGTASFNLGNITSVEVKVCTGQWQVATGTTEWSIDYDCSFLDDGDHTIYVKARAGEDEVSPTETIVAVQDRSSSNNGGPNTPSSDSEEETTLWENQVVRSAIILAVLVGLGFVVTLWYRNRRPSQEMTLY
jgi:hypothetical protein